MAEVNNSGTEYSVTWEAKPLGFSIIMDTEGRNAYVSSIQQEENRSRITLASQIIAVQDKNSKPENVQGMKHQTILGKIIKAQPPITLTFRSMTTSKEDAAPESFTFSKAPDSIKHRVNGNFKKLDEVINDRPVWQKENSNDDDPEIIIWYWPKEQHKLSDHGREVENLWVIQRREHVEEGKYLYACAEDDSDGSKKYPTMITDEWKIFSNGEFGMCKLVITQEST